MYADLFDEQPEQLFRLLGAFVREDLVVDEDDQTVWMVEPVDLRVVEPGA